MIDGSKNDIKNQKRTSLKNVKVSAGGALAPPAFCCAFAGENAAAAEILLPFYKLLAFSGTMW